MKIFYAVQLVCCFVLGYGCQNFLYDGEQIICTLLIHVRIKWGKRCGSWEIVINFDFLDVGLLTICSDTCDILLTHKPYGKFYLL